MSDSPKFPAIRNDFELIFFSLLAFFISYGIFRLVVFLNVHFHFFGELGVIVFAFAALISPLIMFGIFLESREQHLTKSDE